MNYELIKNEFIKLKKEELVYIDNVAKLISNKKLSEYEKLEIYRTLKKNKVKLNEMLEKFLNEVRKFWKEILKDEPLKKESLKEIIIEFDLDKNYLSSINFPNEQYKKIVLKDMGINPENFKFKSTLFDLIYRHDSEIDMDKKILEKDIYIFSGYQDYSEEYYRLLTSLDNNEYIYGIYQNISNRYYAKTEIPKKEMNKFEKDKVIIHSKKYVDSFEIRKILEEELLNTQNITLNDCVVKTRNRIEELNYIRSPEYKERILLDRINKLYKKVKGEFIKKEILYSGDFIDILRETYKLPNENIVQKEKVIKNGGKNSVIIIAKTQDKEYIITFQNRIKDKIIAEFPSGYIENNEDPIKAAKRELKEETGYISDDLFIVDEAYTSPGTDNSITYIVVANSCIKTYEESINSTEFLNYDLFSKIELEYLINKNIMNGAMNKLAYYNLINNVDECNDKNKIK